MRGRARKFGEASLALAIFAVAMIAGAAQAADMETAVLAQLNFARTQPQAYARILREEARRTDSDGSLTLLSQQDADDLDEAVAFLDRQKPLPPLDWDTRLAASARAHARAQGETGEVGHAEDDGTTLPTRLHRVGIWAGLSGENISYGEATARGVVNQFIVDRGIRGRGHRTNMFDPIYQYAGVACGPHDVYRTMCVIDFAGALMKP